MRVCWRLVIGLIPFKGTLDEALRLIAPNWNQRRATSGERAAVELQNELSNAEPQIALQLENPALKRSASAIRSRPWPPFIINNLQDLIKGLSHARGS